MIKGEVNDGRTSRQPGQIRKKAAVTSSVWVMRLASSYVESLYSMSQPHLVLARRYRPHLFSDLVGQGPTVRILQNALRAGRMGHAFLFHGVRGVGKTTLARLLARVVNCTDPSASDRYEPCNQCETCQAILEDRHIDVMEMDAASHTSVDDIRPLIESAPYRPQAARYKIYIIDEVHMLSKSAFNALLKTLEEPPPHVKFVFATTEIRRIPPTIISRCLRFDLRRIPLETLIAHFQSIVARESLQVDEEALKLIARAADGSVRDGLSILDQILTSDLPHVTAAEVRHLLGLSDTQEILALMEELIRGDLNAVRQRLQLFEIAGLDHALVLQECLTLIHHMTQRKLQVKLPETESYPLEVFDRWLSSVSLAWLMRVWQIMVKGLDDLKTALRPDYVLDMTFALCVLVREQGSAVGESLKPDPAMIPSSPPMPLQHPVAQTIDVSTKPEMLSLPTTFEDVVRLFESHKEMILAFHLRHDVELITYEPGTLTFCLRPQAPSDLAPRVTKSLQSWTGYAWHIALSKTRGQAPLAEQYKQNDQELLAASLQHPVAQTIQQAFPEAQVTWQTPS